jgi:hypothetical protein
MLHKDYYDKDWVEKEISGRESQGSSNREELIGDKSPVVK